jgi:hypothetical protein
VFGLAPVLGPALLTHQLAHGNVEGREHIRGGRLGPDHWALPANSDFYDLGCVSLAGIVFMNDFDLHQLRLGIVLGNFREFRGGELTETFWDLDMTSGYDNIHLFFLGLPIGVRSAGEPLLD